MKPIFKKTLGWLILSTIVIFIYYNAIMNIQQYPNNCDMSQFLVGMTGVFAFLGIIIGAMRLINS